MSLSQKIRSFTESEKLYFRNSSVLIKLLVLLRVILTIIAGFYLVLMFLFFGLFSTNPRWAEEIDFLATFLSLGTILALMLLPHRHFIKPNIRLVLFMIFNAGLILFPIFVRIMIYITGEIEASSISDVIKKMFGYDVEFFVSYIFIGIIPSLFLILNKIIVQYSSRNRTTHSSNNA